MIDAFIKELQVMTTFKHVKVFPDKLDNQYTCSILLKLYLKIMPKLRHSQHSHLHSEIARVTPVLNAH